ncbi:hypothetical protein Syun_018694 [Stephania yunnanensis]|uniref:Uncharacterized protein n=1 Tax=Stephania yunnanensis TaxID=152371 RepID=A0AAP0ISQ3_9MAGN
MTQESNTQEPLTTTAVYLFSRSMRLMSYMNSSILFERFLHPAAVDHTSGYASAHSPKSSTNLQHVPSSRQHILNFLRMHIVEFSQIDARALVLLISSN